MLRDLLTNTPNTVTSIHACPDTVSQKLCQLWSGRQVLNVHDLEKRIEVVDLLDVLDLRRQQSSGTKWWCSMSIKQLVTHDSQGLLIGSSTSCDGSAEEIEEHQKTV